MTFLNRLSASHINQEQLLFIRSNPFIPLNRL
jgi:hypothetical protein